MTTVAQLTEDVRNEHLIGMFRHITGQLASGVSGSATSLTLKTPLHHVQRGSIVAVEDELCYVVEAATNSATLLVIRGWAGTAAAAHSANDEVELNSRYPRPIIKRVMRDELRSWPEDLYTTQNIATSLGASETNIQLDVLYPGATRVLRVLRQRSTPYTDRWVRQEYHVEHDSRGPNTIDVFIDRRLGTSTSFRLIVAMPFDVDEWTDATDLEDDVGLSTSMLDVLKFGTAARMVSSKEVMRLYSEQAGSSRAAEEVPAGETRAQGEYFRQLRAMRLREEAMRLARRWGLNSR